MSSTNRGRRNEHLKSPEHVQRIASALKDPLDLIETFGPLSGMHAAMAARGVGMPCGVVARFRQTGSERLEAAIEKAKQRFPTLDRRVSWIGFRPTLVKDDATNQSMRNLTGSLFDLDCTSWQYRIVPSGTDAWLGAIWPHAMADGPSMLRFLESVAATIANQPLSSSRYRGPRQAARRSMSEWMVRFLINQSHRYLRPIDQPLAPGVAWCSLQREQGLRLIENSRAERASAAAWLAAAACFALCQQKSVTKGRVLLNIQVEQSSLEHIGGFGFAAGSLLIPVKVNRECRLPALARGIYDQLTSMINRGWNDNFERFLGNKPQRHLWLAGFHARGRPAPIVSISWKGGDWELGGHHKIGDVACFALSPTLHISGHLDWSGMSLSVTSKQSEHDRQDLLRRLAHGLCGTEPGLIFAFDGLEIAQRSLGLAAAPALCSGPRFMRQ